MDFPVKSRGQSGLSSIALIAVILLSLLAVGGGAAYYYLYRPVAGTLGLLDAAPRFAPAETQLYLAVNFEDYGWDRETVLAYFQALKTEPDFQEWQKEFKRESGFELNDETVGWLAPKGFALAVAPTVSGQSLLAEAQTVAVTRKANALLLVEMNDRSKMLGFLERFTTYLTKDAQVSFKDEVYRGVTLHVPNQPGQAPTWAMKDGLILITLTPEPLKAALDRFENNTPNLAGNARFREAMAGFKAKGSSTAYVDLKAALQGTALETIVTHAGLRAAATAADWLALSGGRRGAQGVVNETLLHFSFPANDDPLGQKLFAVSNPLSFNSIRLMPGPVDGFAALDLRALWELARVLLESDPETAPLAQVPALKLKEMGLDFENDILAALSGEISYAFTGLDRLLKTEGLAQQDRDASLLTAVIQNAPNVIFALGLADRTKAEALLQRVAGPFLTNFQATQYKDVTIFNQGETAYAFLKEHLVVATPQGGPQLQALIDRKEADSLAATSAYQEFSGASGGGKAILMLYGDTEKLNTSLKQKNAEWARFIEIFNRKLAHVWLGLSLQPEGLGLTTVTTGR